MNTVDEHHGDLVCVPFHDAGELAAALAAPCSRRGLDCRLERVTDGDAIIMRRLLL